MITGIFHHRIGFPKGLVTDFGIIRLEYTNHAIKASKNDRYGLIMLPPTLNTAKAKAVEVEIIRNRLTKIVYRVDYSDKFDLAIVVTHDRKVKTVWLNCKDDNHPTLDESNYLKP